MRHHDGEVPMQEFHRTIEAPGPEART
jgi:hypothetical protein